LPQRRGGPPADGRAEAHEERPPSIARQPGPERKAQEVEALNGMAFKAIRVLAVGDSRLLRMYSQPATCQSRLDRSPKHFGLRLGTAVNDHIVRIPLERDLRMHFLHPLVEGEVEEDVGE
jgi:hypothetical protein